jgi:hypothetical protein
MRSETDVANFMQQRAQTGGMYPRTSQSRFELLLATSGVSSVDADIGALVEGADGGCVGDIDRLQDRRLRNVPAAASLTSIEERG